MEVISRILEKAIELDAKGQREEINPSWDKKWGIQREKQKKEGELDMGMGCLLSVLHPRLSPS